MAGVCQSVFPLFEQQQQKQCYNTIEKREEEEGTLTVIQYYISIVDEFSFHCFFLHINLSG